MKLPSCQVPVREPWLLHVSYLLVEDRGHLCSLQKRMLPEFTSTRLLIDILSDLFFFLFGRLHDFALRRGVEMTFDGTHFIFGRLHDLALRRGVEMTFHGTN